MSLKTVRQRMGDSHAPVWSLRRNRRQVLDEVVGHEPNDSESPDRVALSAPPLTVLKPPQVQPARWSRSPSCSGLGPAGKSGSA